MTRITHSLTFTDTDGMSRSEVQTIDSNYPADAAGEQRVRFNLFSQLRVWVGPQPIPKHNEIARRWLDFPGQPASIVSYFDIRNSQAVWLELSNLVMGAESDLIHARAFKDLEPFQEPPFDDNAAINNLYYLHEQKMSFLNQSVYDVVKIQDIVNRLLHESLGGDLVDTSKLGWERTELTRKNVEAGLREKLAVGSVLREDFDAIEQALSIPRNAPSTAKKYRDRLMHHIRPSVDYHIFFSSLESRVGEEFVDSMGQIATGFRLRTFTPAEYQFEDLSDACSGYLDAVVQMLEKLSNIEILRR